jgi:hypothetical protein
MIAGYDAFGNPLSNIMGNWTTSDTIPQIDPRQASNTPFITYTTANVVYASSGCIIATAVLNANAKDSVCLTDYHGSRRHLHRDNRRHERQRLS